MAIVYYPKDAVTYVRTAPGAEMTGLFIDVATSQIIILSGSMPFSSSVDLITASYALNYLVSSSKADTADTASFAQNAASAVDVLGNQVFS